MGYLGKCWGRAFSGSVLFTDKLSIVAGVLTPAILHVADKPMSDEILAYVAWFIVITVGGGVILRLLAAPYFIWKEDQTRIAELEAKLDSPRQREREKLADILVDQKVKAADEVTRIRRIMADRTTTKDEKKKAFHGSERYADKLFFDPVFNTAWNDFYNAANVAFQQWIKMEETRKGNSIDFVENMKFGRACTNLDRRSSDVVDYLLHEKLPEPRKDEPLLPQGPTSIEEGMLR